MGEKDITEKILEDHNDVFADIINGLLFDGVQEIKPEALENTTVHAQYKAEDGKVHELERDIAKYWKEEKVELAICGIENQSKVERNMPFRIVGYDGAAYRSQLQQKRKNKDYIPDDPTEIRHVDEVLKLLQVMTGDRRYEEIFRKKKEGVHSMCDVAERLEQMGIAKGIEIGRSEGKTEGKIEGKILVYRNLCREGFNEKEARRLTELPEDVSLEQ